MLGTLYLVLAIVLALLCLITTVRNLFINYNFPTNRLKSALVIILTVIVLFSALSAVFSALDMHTFNEALNAAGLSADDKLGLENSLQNSTQRAIVALICGYISYLLTVYLFKDQKKATDKEIAKNAQQAWPNK